jgi:aspartate carbamoyltransferase catalytic subunit
LKYGRTVHSLVTALTKFPGITYYLIAPTELKMPDYVLSYMDRANQKYYEVTSLEDTMPELDILYMTRIQRERFKNPDDYLRLRGSYVLTKKLLADRAGADMLVLHPLPRLDEIEPGVDSDPRAAYFDQVRCGMFIRMALLLKFCASTRLTPDALPMSDERIMCRNASCITRTETYLPRIASKSDGGACAYCDFPFAR